MKSSKMRYAVGVLGGALVGLYWLVFVGIFEIPSWTHGWDIPGWGKTWTWDFPSRLALQHQAVALRIVRLAIDSGIYYIWLPACAGFLLVMLSDFSRGRPWLSVVSNTLWLIVWFSFGAALIGVLSGAFSTTTTSVTHNSEEVLYNGFAGPGIVSFVLNAGGLIPIMAMIGAVTKHTGLCQ